MRNAPETAIFTESEAFSICGAKGIRTPDLLGAIQALYQLSYSPIFGAVNDAVAAQFRHLNIRPVVQATVARYVLRGTSKRGERTVFLAIGIRFT